MITTKKSDHKNKKKTKKTASPVKIAYYIQRMLEKKMEIKEIIIILLSEFYKNDLMKFSELYRHCFYKDDIRRIANLIYNLPKKRLNS